MAHLGQGGHQHTIHGTQDNSKTGYERRTFITEVGKVLGDASAGNNWLLIYVDSERLVVCIVIAEPRFAKIKDVGPL